MPLIGSTITDLDQLKHYSDDSEITMQKDFWGDGTSLVVLDSWLSRGLYAIRSCWLKPEKIKQENKAVVDEVKKLIAQKYDNYERMGYQKKFTDTVSNKIFPESSSDEQQESPLLTVKSLRSTVGSAFLTARREAEKAKRDEIIARFKEEPQKELATIFYNSLFARPSGYRMPDHYQEEAHKTLVGETLDFTKKNSLELSDVTDSIRQHVDNYLTPQRREINSTIRDGILERERITRGYPDHEWAKDIYDEMFLRLDGTFKKLTQEDLSSYKARLAEEKTASDTLFQERLTAMSNNNDPHEFLNLLLIISAIPDQKEKIELRTQLLNAVGISETDRPPSPPSVTSDLDTQKSARVPLFSDKAIVTLLQEFGEICAQINSTPKESSSFSQVREKLISNQAEAREALRFNKELDEKVKTILQAIIDYKIEPQPPPIYYIIGDLVEDDPVIDDPVLEDGTTLV